MEYHVNPDKVILSKLKKLEEVKLREGEKVYKELLKKTILADPWFMMRVAFDWGWLDDQLVGHKLLRHISEHWNRDIGILLPRGHGKTLPMAGIVIHHILNNPDCAILMMHRTDENAQAFGSLVGDILMYNDMLQYCFGIDKNPKSGFLPSKRSDTSLWGNDGYNLPGRKPRLDPTLRCISSGSSIAGKHPDWLYLDDLTEEQNNSPLGWEKITSLVEGCKMLLSSSGFIIWTGTRWHDSDPIGAAERGRIIGKQGNFHFLRESCFVKDDPKLGTIYPAKVRWNMTITSGYTLEALQLQRDVMQKNGQGSFFDAQMRNNPLPSEHAELKIEDVIMYDPKDLPGYISPVRMMGIETTGGGRVIYQGFRDWLDQMNISIPLVEITTKRNLGTKYERISAAIQPIISQGKLFAQKWMIGDEYDTEGLGYEIRRFGKASHDDIVDALHNIPVHLSQGITPPQGSLWELYIAVDLAWTEDKRSDWTVAIAVAINPEGHHYILDYTRFQIQAPTGIYNKLLEFYNRINAEKTSRPRSARKFPGAWR